MRSCLYIGRIRHTRYHPAEHRLDYPLYTFGLSLDELAFLDKNLLFFGYNRSRPLSIHDRDYLDDSGGTIRSKLLRFLKENPLAKEIRTVILITAPRYFRYVFNPVSFYYCYSAEDRLLCTVAEVNNTFGERHLYLPEGNPNQENAYPYRFTAPKAFHVSPFNDMEGSYEFLFGDVRRELDIRIHLRREDKIVFTAELEGKILPLNNKNLLKTLLLHPLIPTLTMTRIYREAAKLYFLRKLPYHEKPVPMSMMTIRKARPTFFQRLGRHFALNQLQRLEKGGINLRFPEGTSIGFGEPFPSETVEMEIHENAFFSRAVLHGDIGLGESYTDGEWDCEDLALLFKLFFNNRDRLSDGNFWTASLCRCRDLLRHHLRFNTPMGSRRNISEHYDLSNNLYRLFLDASMTYSCAVYASPSDSLETAQRTKRRNIIDKARIKQTDHVLEIGCGWGSFAIDAARTTGCRVTGLTISQEQYDFARERVRREGLEDRIEIRLSDYRHIQGVYDRIVSIEMLEAVGQRYLQSFFNRCDQLLKPGGTMVLQTITVPDERYASYRRGTDWIRKHIFPGGHLPCLAVIRDIVAAHTSFVIEEIEEIGDHYVRTLREWRTNFNTHLSEIEGLGFGRSFQRKWNYYLACCEGGFAAGALGNVQIVLRKPGKDS